MTGASEVVQCLTENACGGQAASNELLAQLQHLVSSPCPYAPLDMSTTAPLKKCESSESCKTNYFCGMGSFCYPCSGCFSDSMIVGGGTCSEVCPATTPKSTTHKSTTPKAPTTKASEHPSPRPSESKPPKDDSNAPKDNSNAPTDAATQDPAQQNEERGGDAATQSPMEEEGLGGDAATQSPMEEEERGGDAATEDPVDEERGGDAATEDPVDEEDQATEDPSTPKDPNNPKDPKPTPPKFTTSKAPTTTSTTSICSTVAQHSCQACVAMPGCYHLAKGNSRGCMPVPNALVNPEVLCTNETCCETSVASRPAVGRQYLNFRLRLHGAANVSYQVFRNAVRQTFGLKNDTNIVVQMLGDNSTLRRTPSTSAQITIEVEKTAAATLQQQVNAELQNGAPILLYYAKTQSSDITEASASAAVSTVDDMSPSKSGLSAGATAGIVIAVLVALAAFIVLAVFYRKNASSSSVGPSAHNHPSIRLNPSYDESMA